MKAKIIQFLQHQFEDYMKSNEQTLPFKKQSTKKQFVQIFNRFYCTLYYKIVEQSNNSPTNISIQSLRKLTPSNEKIYFILNFFRDKNYIVPILNEKGHKSYSYRRGSYYQFTDEFIKMIDNSQGYEDPQISNFIQNLDKNYKAEVEQQNEKLLNEIFKSKQNRINEIKHCMNNLKTLSFINNENTNEVNLTKRRYLNNIIKFNYRIYSPFSSTKKHFIKMGCVVDKNGNSIAELNDLNASGVQMLQIIMKSKIKDCDEQIKWIEDIFNEQHNFYKTIGNRLGWNYKKQYYKDLIQWFINSNPVFKKQFITNGYCKEKNKNENALMKLFYQNTPKLFKFLAEYETYSDNGKSKSAIWKLIQKTETIVITHIVPIIEKQIGTTIYTKHDSFNCDEEYCTEKNKLIVQNIWNHFKDQCLNITPKEVIVKENKFKHEIFNDQEHLTVQKLYDYYQNYYCLGKVQPTMLNNQQKVIWIKFNQIVFNPVWNNVDCGNILEGRKLEGDNWASRRDNAKEIIHKAINNSIKGLQKIQQKYGNEIFKKILLVLFQSQQQVLFYSVNEMECKYGV